KNRPSNLLSPSIIFCAEASTGQSVDQTKGTVTANEGAPVRLNCTYQSADYVFWYTQHPGLPPSLLLRLYGTEEVNGFRAKHDSQKKTFHLEKSAIQLRDSAVYFCAVSDTVKLCRGAARQKPAKRKSDGAGAGAAAAQI
uniref:Ig-like domain-containing protein n=1 Tax=Varanus komodoensis TaxID=61221 RepID=A0A8D2IS88_VARKO